MDIDNIIYFLLFVVFFIVVAIKNFRTETKETKSKSPSKDDPYGNKNQRGIPSTGRNRGQSVRSLGRLNDRTTLPEPEVKKEYYSSIASYLNEGISSLESTYVTESSGDEISDANIGDNNTIHPLIDDLAADNNIDELKKAVIYSEILQRRY